jgi:hypothetical protein
MDRRAPLADRLRRGRLAVVSLVCVAVVAACGSAAGGGGGGDGGADSAKIIAVAQTALGTSMVSGGVEGTTITLTLIDGFGKGGAGLFMCDHVKNAASQYDPAGTLTVVMVNQSGDQLAALSDCR